MNEEKRNDQLMDIFFRGGSAQWKQQEPDYDLDNTSGLEIEAVDPEDAKDINQVQSFTVAEEVVGTVYTTYRRKKVEEL